MSDPLKVHVGITGKEGRVGEGLGPYAGYRAEREAVTRGLQSRLTPQQLAAELTAQRKAAETRVAGPPMAAPAAPPVSFEKTLPSLFGRGPLPVADKTAKTPPPDPSRSLYDKLREQEEEHKQERTRRDAELKAQTQRDEEARGKAQSSRVDMDQARKDLDRIMGPRKVEGNGDINVKVSHTRTRRPASVLKHVPMQTYDENERASSGPPAPKAATGESHDAALDS
jgi:hypothetical protein